MLSLDALRKLSFGGCGLGISLLVHSIYGKKICGTNEQLPPAKLAGHRGALSALLKFILLDTL